MKTDKQAKTADGAARRRIVLVGTYKGDQLAGWPGWYCWPLDKDCRGAGGPPAAENSHRGTKPQRETLAQSPQSSQSSLESSDNLRASVPLCETNPNWLSSVTELRLYRGTADERRYRAEFVGVKTREELILNYGYPGGDVSATKNAKNAKGGSRLSRPPKPHGTHYALFKTELLYRHKNAPQEEADAVVVRLTDFARSPKVRKQLREYLQSPDRKDPDLAKLLPSIVTSVPPERLRVCEAAVQLAKDQMMTFAHETSKRTLVPIKPDGSVFSIAFHSSNQLNLQAVSLFAGAGGCSLGAKAAGVKLIGAYEIADPAIRTYLHNFGSGSCRKEDLSCCDFVKLRNGIGLGKGDLDLLIGGPPCQGFTTAGSRSYDDPRNRLVANYGKALEAFYPRWFMMENVEGILTTANGEFLLDCIKAAARIGYSIFLKKVYMQEYGIPQRRKRVILVGNRMGKDFVFPKSECIASGGIFRTGTVSLRDAIGDIENCDIREINHIRHPESGIRLERIQRLNEGQTMRDLPDWLQHESYRRRASRRVCDGTPSEKRGGAPVGLKRLCYDEPCLTITGSATEEFVHPTQNRMLTVRECARIQTFPDDFAFCGTDSQQMTQIGNAIPPKFAECMIRQIQKLDNERTSDCSAGLVRFEVTKASAMSPALESTCAKLRVLMPNHAKQLTLEI